MLIFIFESIIAFAVGFLIITAASIVLDTLRFRSAKKRHDKLFAWILLLCLYQRQRMVKRSIIVAALMLALVVSGVESSYGFGTVTALIVSDLVLARAYSKLFLRYLRIEIETDPRWTRIDIPTDN